MRAVVKRKQCRHTIAKLVLEQNSLRNQMNALAQKIGHAQNAVDLGTSVSPLAASDVQRMKNEWNGMLRQFTQNEFEKINARVDALKLELEILTS